VLISRMPIRHERFRSNTEVNMDEREFLRAEQATKSANDSKNNTKALSAGVVETKVVTTALLRRLEARRILDEAFAQDAAEGQDGPRIQPGCDDDGFV
jgi:hypothetical protein